MLLVEYLPKRIILCSNEWVCFQTHNHINDLGETEWVSKQINKNRHNKKVVDMRKLIRKRKILWGMDMKGVYFY